MATTQPIIAGTKYPNMTDYAVVTDGPFLVQPGQDVTQAFHLPPSAVLTQSGPERPIVCYSLVRRQGTPVLRVHVRKRGALEEVFTWSSPSQLELLQTIMEPITGTLLVTGGSTNKLVFSVTGGQVVVQNVIILFQRSTAPVPTLQIGPIGP